MYYILDCVYTLGTLERGSSARRQTIMSVQPSSERVEDQMTVPEASMKPIQTKLVLLGESAVGKTSIVHRFVQDDFQENREPTIGAAFLTVSRIR